MIIPDLSDERLKNLRLWTIEEKNTETHLRLKICDNVEE